MLKKEAQYEPEFFDNVGSREMTGVGNLSFKVPHTVDHLDSTSLHILFHHSTLKSVPC